MEMMLPVFQKTVDLCNVNSRMKRIALSVLENEESSETPVKSLQILALKVVMKEKMKRDIESKVLFNLVFKEPLDPNDSSAHRLVEGLLENVKRYHSKIWSEDHLIHQATLKLTQDPYILYAIFEQNFQDQNQDQDQGTCIDLTMTKTHLIIGNPSDWNNLSNSVAMILNRENQEFDSFWAMKFFKLFMKKRLCYINLRINGGGELDGDSMENFLENVVKSEFSKKPDEGWKNAVEQGEKIIYEMNVSGWIGEKFTFTYQIRTDNEYDEWEEEEDRLIHYY